MDEYTKYLDPDAPLDVRVADLLDRMTLDEKLSQMTYEAQAIPRLGIPAYNYWGEALHGIARNGRATVFPQAIGMAATWNPALIERTASAIGDEGRAKFHEVMRRRGYSGWYQGLTFWSPNVNIFRDPRWGRGQETWGEDPLLTGTMGAAFVRGMQGDDPQYLKTAACAKHYAVHSGPEKLRHGFNARVSEQDLRETYLPAFRTLVTEAKVEAVMGAYNRTNGEPCCASPTLLQQILRDEWGFTGHVVSDCGALDDIHLHHHVTQDAPESAALALKAGCDLECGAVYKHLAEALARGIITEEDVDRSLARTLRTRFKLGLFDPPERSPYAATPLSVVNSPEHRQLAYTCAAQGTVLLKNNGVLPIRRDINSLFVIGPNAASVEVLLGNYSGMNSGLTTLLEGIAARAPEDVQVNYRQGCQLVDPNVSQMNWAMVEAGNSDITIACMGLSPLLEGEEGESILSQENGDRTSIELPAVQVDFIKKLAATGTKIVLVLTGGSPIGLAEVVDLVDAIVFAWYPGQEGGYAVADVLFGAVNPSGRLPITFLKSTAQLRPFDDYSMAGRTYRYLTEEPLFPFGFGLSYTQFGYADLRLERVASDDGAYFAASVEVANIGERAGAEVVQWFVAPEPAPETGPFVRLIGFERLELAPGEQRTARLTIRPELLTGVDDAGKPYAWAEHFRLRVGTCSMIG